jgi:hypothetical protein
MSSTRTHVRALGPLLGTALFLAGVAQARRIAAGSEDDITKAASATGATRLVAGALLLGWPQLLPALLGNHRGSQATRWLARMIAVREVAFGAATAAAARAGRDPARWLLVLSLIDGAEALVVLEAVRRYEIPVRNGFAFAAADAGSALTAAALRRHARGAVFRAGEAEAR